jgi:hypothetical protein
MYIISFRNNLPPAIIFEDIGLVHFFRMGGHLFEFYFDDGLSDVRQMVILGVKAVAK